MLGKGWQRERLCGGGCLYYRKRLMMGKWPRQDSISGVYKSITKFLRIEVKVLVKRIVIKRETTGKRHSETLAARKAGGTKRNDVSVALELRRATSRSKTQWLKIVRIYCSCVWGGCLAVS